MTSRQVIALIKSQRRINAMQVKHNDRVSKLSKGRAHHQACYIGGLATGAGADVSGSPCWCGEQAYQEYVDRLEKT